MKKEHLLLVGIVIVLVFVIITLFAPLIAPHDPIDYRDVRLSEPNLEHLMGTDNLGRDILSRMIFGGRTPLTVALLSAMLALSIGIVLGMVAGYRGGLVDRILSLVMDAVYSFPGLILAIVITAILGRGIINMVFAVSVIYIPTYFRVVRGKVMQIREETFVEAARALGAPGGTILLRYVAPNTVSSVMAVLPFNIADAILTEAALAFLGFGINPPTPDWGFDIQAGRAFMSSGCWWLITFPGLMIVLTALGFGMLGEGLSDVLNPKRR
jgi:peptide/nickel transport system permease protein